MFIKPQDALTKEQVNSTWEHLGKQEYSLRRKLFLSRLLPPVGSLVFLFNLLLTTTNFLDYFCPESLREYYEVIPVLPKLAAPLAVCQTSLGSMIFFLFWFSFLLPLAVCGLITGGKYVWDHFKNPYKAQPLAGSEAHCAKALAYKAETVYSLRREFLGWSVFLEAAIAAALVAIPAFIACLRIADGDSALKLAAALFVLLLSIFLLYWLFVGLAQLFSLLTRLFFFAPSPWKYWEAFHRIDAYWESVDPVEHAKRERRAQAKRDSHWWNVFKRSKADDTNE